MGLTDAFKRKQETGGDAAMSSPYADVAGGSADDAMAAVSFS